MVKTIKNLRDLFGKSSADSGMVSGLIMAYFIFCSLFITLRILIFGSDTSVSVVEYIFSSLPEILALFVLLYMILKSDLKLFYRQFSLFDKIIALYILTNVVYGTILAHDLKLSIYGFRLTYLPMVFYFIVRMWHPSEMEKYEKLIRKISMWSLTLAIAGLLIYFIFTDFYDYMMAKGNFVEMEYFVRRMGSLFWTPVMFASLMTICGLYFYYKALQKGKWIHYLFFGIIWSCLFLTISRGAIISFFFGLVLLAILMKNWRDFVKSILVMAFVIFCFWMLDKVVTNILAFIFDSAWDTLSMKRGMTRVELWIHAWNDFLNRPMGYGLGMAGHVAARFFGRYSTKAATFSTDGYYLKMLNETGVWGLFSYLILMGTYVVQSVKYLRKHQTDFYLFLFVIILVVAVQNIVSNVNDFYLISSLIWIVIGISQNIYLSWHNEQN